MIVTTLMAGLLPSKFIFSLSKNPLSCMADLMVKVQQHMNTEDTSTPNKNETPRLAHSRTKRKESKNLCGKKETIEREKATVTARSDPRSISSQAGSKTTPPQCTCGVGVSAHQG